MNHPVSIAIRQLSSQKKQEDGDWKAVCDLCCCTANNGQPIAPERWGLFGRLWVEPYEKICPQWIYVAEAGGSLAGCPDSRGFAKAKRRRLALPLLIDIFRGIQKYTVGVSKMRHPENFANSALQRISRKFSHRALHSLRLLIGTIFA
jgi:hypothetical protein